MLGVLFPHGNHGNGDVLCVIVGILWVFRGSSGLRAANSWNDEQKTIAIHRIL